MLNVGESLRGRAAPCWFIFLSNRKKKKENTSFTRQIAPTPFPGYPGPVVVKVRFEVLSASFVFRWNIRTLCSQVLIFPLRLCCGKSKRDDNHTCASHDGVRASCVLQGRSALGVGVREEDSTGPGWRRLRLHQRRSFVAWDMKPGSKAEGK